MKTSAPTASFRLSATGGMREGGENQPRIFPDDAVLPPPGDESDAFQVVNPLPDRPVDQGLNLGSDPRRRLAPSGADGLGDTPCQIREPTALKVKWNRSDPQIAWLF